jgi:hypothetical protein
VAAQIQVVEAADGDHVFVADLSAESTGLSDANVMGFGRRAAAHDARLSRDELTVLLVPQANGFRCNATTAHTYPVNPFGLVSLSRANQSAAFARTSRS